MISTYEGALLAEHPTEGKDDQILGSVVVYTGGGPEEVRQMIEKDIYATSGVWDLEKVQIYPVCWYPAFEKRFSVNEMIAVCGCCSTATPVDSLLFRNPLSSMTALSELSFCNCIAE